MTKILFFAALSAAVMIKDCSNDDKVNNAALSRTNEISFRISMRNPEARVAETTNNAPSDMDGQIMENKGDN
jgi:outer membrane murein-binding lipoprotein Lpp